MANTTIYAVHFLSDDFVPPSTLTKTARIYLECQQSKRQGIVNGHSGIRSKSKKRVADARWGPVFHAPNSETQLTTRALRSGGGGKG